MALGLAPETLDAVELRALTQRAFRVGDSPMAQGGHVERFALEMGVGVNNGVEGQSRSRGRDPGIGPLIAQQDRMYLALALDQPEYRRPCRRPELAPVALHAGRAGWCGRDFARERAGLLEPLRDELAHAVVEQPRGVPI